MAYDRNLASINRKLLKGSEILQESIRERLGQDASIAVLDIGCGVGVSLMELSWMFRNHQVEFVGINKDAGEPLASREDFLTTARQIGLAPEAELAHLRLPSLFFEDATEMHFENESFDIVYASSVLRFVSDKAKLLEDVVRVLRPGGVAIIRVGSKGWDYPFGETAGGDQLTPYASRWVLKYENELIPLEAYLKVVSGNGVELELINRPQCVIRVTKQRSVAFTLDLRHVPELSLPMTQLGYGDEDRGLSKGGVRSVYEVPASQYQVLVERELLEAPDIEAAKRQREVHEPKDFAARVWHRAAAAAGVIFYLAPMTACGATRTLTVMHRLNWRGVLVFGVLGLLLLPGWRKSRLSSYRVGQRVNIKGRRKGRTFRAAKIKMVHHVTADDHIEGPVESVDVARRTVEVLGIAASAEQLAAADEVSIRLEALEPGMKVRLRGKCSHGTFVATDIDVVPPSPILIEEIQGPIEVVAPALGVLQVAGIPIITDDETKIDRINAR